MGIWGIILPSYMEIMINHYKHPHETPTNTKYKGKQEVFFLWLKWSPLQKASMHWSQHFLVQWSSTKACGMRNTFKVWELITPFCRNGRQPAIIRSFTQLFFNLRNSFLNSWHHSLLASSLAVPFPFRPTVGSQWLYPWYSPKVVSRGEWTFREWTFREFFRATQWVHLSPSHKRIGLKRRGWVG